MLSIPEQEFQRVVRACLAALEVDLTATLASLIWHKYPNEVVALDFEVYSDEFTSGFPVRTFFLDQQNGQATYPSPVDPGLLAIDCVYSEKIEEELTAASPESNPWHIATSELFDWFLACWRKAGGTSFRLAAAIAHHDSTTELNLVTGKTQPRRHAFDA